MKKGISDAGIRRLARSIVGEKPDQIFRTELYGGAYAFLDEFLDNEFKYLEGLNEEEWRVAKDWVEAMKSDLEHMGQLGQDLLAIYMTKFSKYL